MKWRTYGKQDDDGDIVYFSGVADRSLIGLGGSERHLIGRSKQSKEVDSSEGSAVPPIVRFLRNFPFGDQVDQTERSKLMGW